MKAEIRREVDVCVGVAVEAVPSSKNGLDRGGSHMMFCLMTNHLATELPVSIRIVVDFVN